MPVTNPQSVTLRDLIHTKLIIKRLVEMGVPLHFDTVSDERYEITVSEEHLHELKALMLPSHIKWKTVSIDRALRKVQSALECEFDDTDAIREICLQHYPDTGKPRLVQVLVGEDDDLQLGFDATSKVSKKAKKKDR